MCHKDLKFLKLSKYLSMNKKMKKAISNLKNFIDRNIQKIFNIKIQYFQFKNGHFHLKID